MKKRTVILTLALICSLVLFISVLQVENLSNVTSQDQVAYQENVAGTGFFSSIKRWVRGDKGGETTPPETTTTPTTSTTPTTPNTHTPTTPTPTTPDPVIPPVDEVISIVTGLANKTLTVGGANRTYITYIPKSLSTKKTPIDMLIVLHGTGGTGAGIRDTGFDAYADTKGFITVYPDSLVRDGTAKWDPTNRQIQDIDFIQAIIAEMKTLPGAQIGNIYIAGMSNGSVMTQAVGCVTAEIDGIAAVSAGMGSEFFPYCTANRPLPYIGFYGTLDRFDEMAKYESSVAFFAKENGCTDSFTATTMPNIDTNDGTTVEKRVYKASASSVQACSTPVHYYRITGGGHFWPGGDNYQEDRLERNTGSVTQDIDATKLIVEFFGL